jgi:pimeloyl-ACP methyl ester carboxylesterase
MANEFEREMTAPSIMAGRDGPARTIAADAATMARANILASRDAAPDPEIALTRNTTSWPITRPNIPGAEPGESPLLTVFRQARTEIGGWGVRTETGIIGGDPVATSEMSAWDRAPQLLGVHALLVGARRSGPDSGEQVYFGQIGSNGNVKTLRGSQFELPPDDVGGEAPPVPVGAGKEDCACQVLCISSPHSNLQADWAKNLKDVPECNVQVNSDGTFGWLVCQLKLSGGSKQRRFVEITVSPDGASVHPLALHHHGFIECQWQPYTPVEAPCDSDLNFCVQFSKKGVYELVVKWGGLTCKKRIAVGDCECWSEFLAAGSQPDTGDIIVMKYDNSDPANLKVDPAKVTGILHLTAGSRKVAWEIKAEVRPQFPSGVFQLQSPGAASTPDNKLSGIDPCGSNIPFELGLSDKGKRHFADPDATDIMSVKLEITADGKKCGEHYILLGPGTKDDKRIGKVDPSLSYNQLSVLGDEVKRQYVSAKCPCCELLLVHGWRPAGESPEDFFFSPARFGLRRAKGCCELTGVAWDAEGAPWLAASNAAKAGRILANEIIRAKVGCPDMRIDIAGHSMGARVVLTALKHLPPGIVDNAYLLNPAVDWDVFEDSKDYANPEIPGNRGEFRDAAKGAKNIYIFHSSLDEVLLDLYPLYGRTALGLGGPKDPKQVPSNVHSYDFTAKWGEQHMAVFGSGGPDFFSLYRTLSPGDRACCP